MDNEKFKVNPIFSKNMVLQRGVNIPIWGTGQDGTKVIVEFCNQIKEVQVQHGKWMVNLDPISFGGPYDMKIENDLAEIILANILIGDVWLAGGQSNMEFNLKDSKDAKEEIQGANFSSIRFYQVPKIDYEDETTLALENPGWQAFKTENIGELSAVAYYFAKNIYKTLEIPIGIINCNRGGTSASCWVSKEYLSSDEDTKVYLDEYYEQLKKVTDEEYEIEAAKYNKGLEEYNKKFNYYKLLNPNATVSEIDAHLGCYPWPPPMGKKSYRRPNGLYNIMIKKVAPYAIKGFLWYQGEEDAPSWKRYKKLFGMVIKNWRELWQNDNIPFLYVQLPSFGDSNPKIENWPRTREAQLEILKEFKNTGMVVTIDCGEEDNIHPVNKKPVGDRLALLARGMVYNDDIVYSGPIFKSIKIEGNKAIVSFEHVGSGLVFKDENVIGFKICGQDKKFIDAKAKIVGNTIEVYSDKIDKPTAVRYGWSNFEPISLYNKEGLPASPFRTDKF